MIDTLGLELSRAWELHGGRKGFVSVVPGSKKVEMCKDVYYSYRWFETVR
jgi:hypothetical protein